MKKKTKKFGQALQKNQTFMIFPADLDEVAALDHELFDDSMKLAVFKANGHPGFSIWEKKVIIKEIEIERKIKFNHAQSPEFTGAELPGTKEKKVKEKPRNGSSRKPH